MSLLCDTCNSRLKIKVHGGEFLLTDDSTMENINFNTVEEVVQKALGTKVPDDEKEDILTVEVECSLDPEHLIFQSSVSKIKCEIFMRIAASANRLTNKYYF
jgi:hypothetical protein